MSVFSRLADRFPNLATVVLVVSAVVGGSMLATFTGCADFGFSQGEQVMIHGQLPVLKSGDEPNRFTIVTYNQQVPSWMLATNKLKLSFVVKGDVTPTQLEAVASSEPACRIYTGKSRPNELVGAIANGTLYAGVNFPVGGLAATAAFRNAPFLDYATYSGISYGGGGFANGIVQIGGKTYTFANCGREIFEMFPEYHVKVLTPSPY